MITERKFAASLPFENHLRSQSGALTGFVQIVLYTDAACTKIGILASIYAVGVCLDYYTISTTEKSMKYIYTAGGGLTLTTYSDTGCANGPVTSPPIITSVTFKRNILRVQLILIQHLR